MNAVSAATSSARRMMGAPSSTTPDPRAGAPGPGQSGGPMETEHGNEPHGSGVQSEKPQPTPEELGHIPGGRVGNFSVHTPLPGRSAVRPHQLDFDAAASDVHAVHEHGRERHGASVRAHGRNVSFSETPPPPPPP